MESNESWIREGEGLIPPGHYMITGYTQNCDGVLITLDDEKNKVDIFFDDIPLLVCDSKEAIRMRTWGEAQLKYQDKRFFTNWFFYQVLDSKLSEWVENESCGFYRKDEFKHYCIVTGDELLDILSTFKPTIKISRLTKTNENGHPVSNPL